MIGFIEFENGRDHQLAQSPLAKGWDDAWPHVMALLEANYRLNKIKGEYDAKWHEATGTTFMHQGNIRGTLLLKRKLDEGDYCRRRDGFMKPIRERREMAINEVNKHYRSVDAIMQPVLKTARRNSCSCSARLRSMRHFPICFSLARSSRRGRAPGRPHDDRRDY